MPKTIVTQIDIVKLKNSNYINSFSLNTWHIPDEKIISITNQAGIATGDLSHQNLQKINMIMK